MYLELKSRPRVDESKTGLGATEISAAGDVEFVEDGEICRTGMYDIIAYNATSPSSFAPHSPLIFIAMLCVRFPNFIAGCCCF